MAQFVHQYVAELLKRQESAGQILGVSPLHADKQTYVVDLTLLTLIGVVMKKISEIAPAVTDAVWIDALNHALDSSGAAPWPDWILNQYDPNNPPEA